MLQDLRVLHALPEAERPERPCAGVVAHEEESGEAEEDERPVSGPGRPSRPVKDGWRGVKTSPTSAGVARSATTSTAGGSEVREAAAKSTVIPSPSSTSMKRRRRTHDTSPPAGSLRTAKKLRAPRTSRSPRMAILVSTIIPYAVPITA